MYVSQLLPPHQFESRFHLQCWDRRPGISFENGISGWWVHLPYGSSHEERGGPASDLLFLALFLTSATPGSGPSRPLLPGGGWPGAVLLLWWHAGFLGTRGHCLGRAYQTLSLLLLHPWPRCGQHPIPGGYRGGVRQQTTPTRSRPYGQFWGEAWEFCRCPAPDRSRQTRQSRLLQHR